MHSENDSERGRLQRHRMTPGVVKLQPVANNQAAESIREVLGRKFRHRKLLKFGDPYGNRTRVSAVKGPRPNR